MPKQQVKKRKKVAAGKRLFRSAAEGLTVGVRLFKIFVENFLRFFFLSFCPFFASNDDNVIDPHCKIDSCF
jgi:hypothetical protein